MIFFLSRFILRPDLRRQSRSRRSSRLVLDGCDPLLEARVLLSNVSVLQYRNDSGNTGQNLLETTLTPSDVNPTDFGEFYQYPVDGYVYAQPLYMANLAIPGQGTHNVVFVVTEHDSVYAFDADGGVGPDGSPLWHDSFIDPAAGITTLDQTDVFGVSDIVPEVGITATPVIDPASGALYVVTKTKDMEGGVEHIVQQLHALSVATGAEMFGGPVTIADTTVNPDGSYTYNSGPSVAGTGDGSINGVLSFNALSQNERAALVLNGGLVYLSYSSHGDSYPNHGWILGYNAQTLQPTAVFCATPNGSDGTIWGAGEGLAVDSQGNMYFVTGNGTFDTTLVPGTNDPSIDFPSEGDYGDSVVKIAVDPTSTPSNPDINGWGLQVLDYFTPSDQQSLDDNDTDYGSGGPLLLPATATGPQVLLTAGKEGTIYVIDTDTGQMGEFNANSNNVYQEIQGQIGGMWGSPVYFNGSVYYGSVGDNIEAFQLQANNMLSTSPTSTSPESFGYPGPNPEISADGSSDGILWAIDDTAYGSQGPGVLYAYDAANLGNELYNSSDAGARDQSAGAVKFTVPTIAGGMVYVGGEYALNIYGLIGAVTIPAAPSKLVAEAISSNQVGLSWQNNASNETGFTIERSTDGVNFTAVATVGPYIQTCTDGDLAALTRYVYEVVATNAAGSSAPSNQAAAETVPQGYIGIDAGGGPTGTFEADADFSGGSIAIFMAPINTGDVTDPAPIGVYQTERYGTFRYTIPGLKPGTLYTVRLHFSEDTEDSSGRRLFNLSIGGTQVLSNFDIYAAAGGMDTAVVEQFAAVANSQGQLVIAFAPSAQSPDRNAAVAGIEIVPVQFNQQLLANPASISAAARHTFSGTLATFVDTSPGGLARDYIATTNWGDGTVTTSTVNPVASGSGFSIAGNHVYQYGGRYNVTVIIQSYDGAGARVTETAIVTGPPLLKSIGTKTTVRATVGKTTGNLVLATFSDTNAGAPPRSLASRIFWSDGSASQGTVVAVRGGFAVVGSHTYARAGTYLTIVRLTDSGASIHASTTSIVVSRAKRGHFRAVRIGRQPKQPKAI